MKAPALAAVMERRILVNYRVIGIYWADLPAPFRPALVAVTGCGHLPDPALPHPARWTARCRLRSETPPTGCVCWSARTARSPACTSPGATPRPGWPRSPAGRLFPGYLHLARFRTHEDGEGYRIQVASRDGMVHIEVEARRAEELAPGSIFTSLDAASGSFRCAPAGYAATRAQRLRRVELETAGWTLEPLRLDRVTSSFFDDRRRFPAGTAEPDSAFLMSGLSTIWHPQPRLQVIAAAGRTGHDMN